MQTIEKMKSIRIQLYAIFRIEYSWLNISVTEPLIADARTCRREAQCEGLQEIKMRRDAPGALTPLDVDVTSQLLPLQLPAGGAEAIVAARRAFETRSASSRVPQEFSP